MDRVTEGKKDEKRYTTMNRIAIACMFIQTSIWHVAYQKLEGYKSKNLLNCSREIISNLLQGTWTRFVVNDVKGGKR